MGGLILYTIKSTIYLSVFYAFFMLIMRKTTFIRLNRIVFMAGTLTCMILPFINIGVPEGIQGYLPMAVIENALNHPGTESVILDGSVITDGAEGGTATLIGIILIVGALGSFLIMTRSYLLMKKMIRSVKSTDIDGVPVKITDTDIPSFSWGRHIVISRKDLEKHPAILIHEMMHARCGHSIDLTAYTIVTTLHWFNPLIWIARTELKMLHEYEADELTIDTGIDATQYQLLLVRKAVGAKRFQLANGFNHSKLKNRITMMNKTKTNKWMRLAYILCVPVLIGTMCCCSQIKNGNKDVSSPEISQETSIPANVGEKTYSYDEVEVKPTFQGEDANAFAKWVNTQMKYPEEAKEKGIEGRVVLSFTVASTGKVCDVKVLRGVDPLLDEEAVRTLENAPEWTPGKVNGTAVPVSYVFPLVFMLK
jgi:TonB family protein